MLCIPLRDFPFLFPTWRMEDSHQPLLNSPANKGGTSVAAIFCSRNPATTTTTTTSRLSFEEPNNSSAHKLSFACKLSRLNLILAFALLLTSSSIFLFVISPILLAVSLGNRSVKELKQIQELLLLRVYNASETLVALLQERSRLTEEIHVRLLHAEELHRLLESRCFYRGLSTGLLS